ncbi:response regulator [Azospirillum sp.]|uniref:response regulator n=1 Tax=Azospirillum sp. TaxID=34012 RepID=UPI003D765AF5
MTSVSPSAGVEKARVLIADDHPLFRTAMHNVIDAVYHDAEFIEASDLDEMMSLAAGAELDLVVLDLNIPGATGFCGLVQLRNELPNVPVVVVSADEGADVAHDAITYGAVGYIPKSLTMDAMVKALNHVIGGGVYLPPTDAKDGKRKGTLSEKDLRFAERVESLSAQQRVVLQMLVEGRPNKQIAYLLDVTESTVKAHVSAILRKLDVQSRTQAVICAGKLSLQAPHHPLSERSVRH